MISVPSVAHASVDSFGAQASPIQHTRYPYVTGSSVLAIKYKDGVMMASDTLASYGSLARFQDVRRMKQVGEKTLVGAGGEISDFQYICNMLDEMIQTDYNLDDGFSRSPLEIHSYLRAVMYQRRNKFNPLWNYVVVAGYDSTASKPFLGFVDHIGTAYEENLVATGFGLHLALPIMRRRWSEGMDESEARALLEDCMRVLFLRDCRSTHRIQIAKATQEGTMISDPYPLEIKEWDYEHYRDPTRGDYRDGSW
mmetsp:Transcript_15850/g.23298  ORF Transcript_15850/g.23298 Transcript_15850/m.23298 type:complete len:253 (-) Transcript_15850:169-927(-)|eukprot:CAMPEP_0113933546 /NCGR_PEP_ID=MMETSP1339-20121228/614_1 /TAXON_ID=94617 /ORGANISM="Fibrocapsa japonica" /LENGTH=252 /DNA_ID=CAMNT_0000934853 /DNA_START=142 /DNA_END=900 /DNA_ORIENTATION=- /assembly_acc=CAM_ASM_000762